MRAFASGFYRNLIRIRRGAHLRALGIDSERRPHDHGEGRDAYRLSNLPQVGTGVKPEVRVSSETGTPQHILLRSNAFTTASVHVQLNSVLVTANPPTLIDETKVIQSASFTCVLRSL
ncbi:hypothetical protein EMGR_000142 [Emarellia grisea]